MKEKEKSEIRNGKRKIESKKRNIKIEKEKM